MKRFYFSFVALLMASLAMFAAKPTIYVQQFENSANVKPAWVELVRSAVLEGFYNTNRTIIVDAVTEESRYEEEIRRLKDNLSTDNLETTEALKTLGAHVLLNGDITALTVPATKLEGGTTKYDATVTFTLKVVNALDGSMIGTKTFTLPKSLMGISISSIKNVNKSEDEAVQNIKGDIAKAMKDFVNESFPIQGEYIDLGEYTKNKKGINTFYINIGEEDGVAKGQKMDIKIEQKIGKSTALRTIGEGEVEEVAGDDVCLIKVKKGQELVKDAIDKEQKVVVLSKSKKK